MLVLVAAASFSAALARVAQRGMGAPSLQTPRARLEEL